eukprot:jgi/Hompol1/3861/HPOL_006791-RA
MGFSEAKVARALKATKNAGLQSAMDWLFAHADEPDDAPESQDAETLQAGGSSNSAEAAAAADDGEISADQLTAQSLKCDDCGKLLRDASFSLILAFGSTATPLDAVRCVVSTGAAAEAHAVRTQHVNFSESTMAIKPLTPEEKAEKLKQLQARLAAKREEKRLMEIEESKSKEKIRRKTGQEIQVLKEKQEEAEMKKAFEAKKREKEEEKAARERVKAQLEADRLERQRKA